MDEQDKTGGRRRERQADHDGREELGRHNPLPTDPALVVSAAGFWLEWLFTKQLPIQRAFPEAVSKFVHLFDEDDT